MKNKLILIILSIAITYGQADNDYLWPTNTSNSITTLFGEKRSRRFHAGIDVRTFGKIGDKVFAIESGYISRIRISSDGYGKALYLKLNLSLLMNVLDDVLDYTWLELVKDLLKLQIHLKLILKHFFQNNK